MNGRIVTGTDVVCADDPDAFAWAATKLGLDARAEIWQAERCLGGVSDSAAPPDRSAREGRAPGSRLALLGGLNGA
jgi:hypothetical protein